MPIIGKVGRKTFKVRILNFMIHFLLLLGALTMIYPFMVMISASFKSNVDTQSFSVYPQFFFDDSMLYRKYIEARMNELGERLGEQYKNRAMSFTLLEPPERHIAEIYEDWGAYLDSNHGGHNIFDYYISEQYGRGVYPRNERKFRSYMKKKSGNSLIKLNELYQTSTLNWEEVRLEESGIAGRNFSGDYTGFLVEYDKFRLELPLWHRLYTSLDGNFINSELLPVYRNDLRELNADLGSDYVNWEEIKLEQTLPAGALQPFWVNYVKNRCNIHHITLLPEALPFWRDYLEQKYEKISLLNRTWKTDYHSFEGLNIPVEIPRSGAMPVDYTFFIEAIAEPEWLKLSSVEFEYRRWLEDSIGEIGELNKRYQRGYGDFTEIELPFRQPRYNLAMEADWIHYLRNLAESSEIRLLPLSQQQFLLFLQEKFPREGGGFDLDGFNRFTDKSYTQIIDIYPPREQPADKNYQKIWLQFIREVADGRFLVVGATETAGWQGYLREKYGNPANLNNAWHLVYHDFSEIPIDHVQIDYSIFREHKIEIFWEFVIRNYVMVLDEMLYNGRSIVNTVIYCLLAIISALIVNPLAAYAMSRYKLRATYKIILVLMLTMAFPAMVMGIPNFLIMKRFGMLNTFWALILPGLADGYFIFLLKGFFDSLPKELFESATLDGASEWVIFWRIAMSLSKPIMAVIALNAFNAAYRNFMFAFIVCQDKSMWTMMVNIYQMMQRTSAGVGFAALVIASIPTFAVFVFFQNIIIRGIVVPTEK
jgi:ABC-type glycerol-3-phosphate transport system permease component